MGIRFLCEHCQRRLNVKDTQAGQYCFCPDCEKEILVPMASTIGPPMRRKKKRSKRKKRKDREVDTLPVGDSPVETSPVDTESSLAIDSATLMPSSFPAVMDRPVEADPPIEPVVEPDETIETAGSQLSNGAPLVSNGLRKVEPVADSPRELEPETPELDDASIFAQRQDDDFPISEPQGELTGTGDEDVDDSSSALDVLTGSSETPTESKEQSETESFLLSKPVTKIEEDPLKSDPNLIWYLRHRRLGEKGPLKARQVEEMLRSGQLRSGAILWREDWNDWVAAEEVFPELLNKSQSKSTYTIPDELNPHSEASRKRRARKHYLMAFNAAAFLLVIVLVYWIATLVR